MRKRGGSFLFLPASKALLLGIRFGIMVYSSKASAHASGVSRARWRPLHARASRLGDRHLIWETDVSSGRPTSHLGDRHLVPHITLVRVASTSDGYRRLENARVERNKFVTRGAAAHVALVDCFR